MKTKNIMDYPIAIKKTSDYLVLSLVDLDINISHRIERDMGAKELAVIIAQSTISLWQKGQRTINAKLTRKKPYAPPSLLKNTLAANKRKRGLTPSQFAREVGGVSYRTVIRACDSGLIKGFKKTPGGHYLINHDEVIIFSAYLSNHKKHASEPYAEAALDALRGHLDVGAV